MRSLLLIFALGCNNAALSGDGTPPANGSSNSPRSCGAKQGDTCSSDEYCSYPAAESCGNFDSPGTCQPRPNACTDILQPVCGCDGVSYDNRCFANAAGVAVAYDGGCPSPPAGDCTSTGCPTGKQCQLCWNSYRCLGPDVVC